jgi:hypothetical protein
LAALVTVAAAAAPTWPLAGGKDAGKKSTKRWPSARHCGEAAGGLMQA